MSGERISGILLAGGKSTRMGSEKAFLNFRGKSLFKYPLGILEKFCSEIIVSTNSKAFQSIVPYRLVGDEIEGKGPLGGLYTCLKQISNYSALVLGCDMPFISEEYIRILIRNSKGHSVCMGANSQGTPEALAAIYNRSLIPFIDQKIQSGVYRMNSLLEHKGSLLLDPKLFSFDLDRNFLNINSPDDLKSTGLKDE